MESLNSKIKSIINEAKELRQKYNIDGELDYVAIFSHNNDEYEFYCQEAGKLGEIFDENISGITFILKEEFQTVDGSFNLLKIRKADESKTQLGAPDYKIQDYDNFKKTIFDDKNFKIVKSSDDYELIELSDPEFDVLIYFPQIPLSEELNKAKDPDVENVFEQLKKDFENEKHKRLELMADFQNYQKRVQQEKSNWGAIANIAILQDILEVYDDMQMALDDEALNLDSAKQALETAQKKLIDTVSRAGLEKIDVKIGDDFDKEKMEAVSAIQVDDENKKNKVIAVISSAYKYTNKEGILKPAKVVVGK